MDGLLVLAAFGLVLLNGFFVATEFAIVKIRVTRLQTLVEEGKPGAANAMKMVEQLDSYLSATQFGITLASLGLGWIGEPAFAHLIEGPISKLLAAVGIVDPAAATGVSHAVAVAIAFALITFLHIVIGELAPKSLAIQRAEQTSLAVAVPMRIFHFLFYPGIWLLNGMAGKILRAFKLSPASEAEDAHDEEELRVILTRSARSGKITSSRAELIDRALSMTEKTARHILVPRSQVRFLDLEEPLDKNIHDARASGHTWLPVIRGNLDRVEGVVNVKDLFFVLSNNELKSIAQIQRPVVFVPENVTLEQLLTEFRRRRRQLAVVVDEHGGTTGIVTLADVVAEVVGDVAELGRKVDEVKTLPGGRLELQGSAQLDDLEDRLGVKFEVDEGDEGEITTVAGYLMYKLNRIPVVGDKVPVEEWMIAVEQMEGPRVMKVRVEPKITPASVPLATGGATPPSSAGTGPGGPAKADVQ